MLPTQEQIKEFWEWCGWRIVEDIGLWYSVDPLTSKRYMGTSNKELADRGLLYLPIDLNNLFKGALISFGTEGWVITISFDQEFRSWDVELSHPTKQAVLKQMQNLEDSIFWAIWEVIHDNMGRLSPNL